MTCKDCIHYDVCQYHIDEETKCTLAEIGCADFKDKSKFVELPCKVGDTFFFIDDKYVKVGRRKEHLEFINVGIVDHIVIGEKGTPQIDVCNNENVWTMFDSEDDFGKMVFLTRAEAENALKQKS